MILGVQSEPKKAPFNLSFRVDPPLLPVLFYELALAALGYYFCCACTLLGTYSLVSAAGVLFTAANGLLAALLICPCRFLSGETLP